MKIKEMFEKLENYNELARICKDSEKRICFYFDDGIGFGYGFDSFKEFKKYCKEELIDEFVNAIMKAEYEFNVTKEIIYVDRMGDLQTSRISFAI